MKLPAAVDDLRGLRAARWIRESTASQFDRYGPDAQRELAARAIARLGLTDTGLEWSAAQSGSTVHAGPAMRAMLDAAAAGAFDILVVAYVARWQRNLRQTLNLLEDQLHPAGVAVWFADEELLSSSERHWDQLVDEAKSAESWLRRHRRRVREGLAAKLATRRDPAGRPGFGFRRNAEKLLEPDPASLVATRKIFELAAARLTDRQVADATGLGLYTVRGVLTNPLYAGRLRDGRATTFPAIVPPTLFDAVQAVRAVRRTRDRRPAVHRTYALSMLHCAACGRRLIGDTGRHLEPCPAFVAAAPRAARRHRGQHATLPGHSYAADAYETVVRRVLARIEAGADLLAAVLTDDEPQVDRLALARIERDRETAAQRYIRDRDGRSLELAMVALDEQARAARANVRGLGAAERVAYLRDLPRLWDEAPDSRRVLAEALFERIDALGLRKVHIEPTSSALRWGLVEAFYARSGGYGRGERIRPRDFRLIVGVAGERVAVTMGGQEKKPPGLAVVA